MIQQINSIELIKLYTKGYFPMADNSSCKEINFYKPHLRFLLPIYEFHLPKKLFNEFKKNRYDYKIDTNFSKVINECSKIKRKEGGTWINDLIVNSYIELNKRGYAHSVECWEKNKLIAGLYGIHIGSCFFGESMFSKRTNTSKLTLLYLISVLIKNKFNLLDSQFYNQHLVQFGGYEISDIKYQILLKKGISKKSIFKNNLNFHESLSILQSLIHTS